MKLEHLPRLAVGYGSVVAIASALVACTTLQAATPPQSITAQLGTHCKPMKMPFTSELRGESGLVRVAVRLAPDGSVSNARVSHSSGFSALDQAVLDNVRACKFDPPTSDASEPQTESEIPVRFAFDVRTWFPLEGVANTAHLEQFVADTNQRCGERGGAIAERIQNEAADWHARNNAISRLVLDYKQRYYGDIRQYAANEHPDAAIAKLDNYLQSTVTTTGANARADLDHLSSPQQQAYCQRYADRLSSGALDLMRVVIQFPELEFFIDKRTSVPEAP